jgi:hypothetical protein
MPNRNFDASVVTRRLRDKNVAQQIYGTIQNGRSVGNPQTVNFDVSLLEQYEEGVETTTEFSLRSTYSFDPGAIANYVALGEVGGGDEPVPPPPAPTVPDAPTGVSAIMPTAGQATVTFTPPTSDGGSAITGYTVTSSPEGITATGGASPIIVTGLGNGITYTFTVVATNAVGDSAASSASNSVSFTGTLTRQSFTTVGTTSWTAPAGVRSVDYLVVGGGGGGGNGFDTGGGGGGGGGMVLTSTLSVTPTTSYTVTVGAGGTGGAAIRTNINGIAGDSSIFDSITAFGGGAGNGSRSQPGGSGAKGVAQVSNVSAATGGSGGGNVATSVGGCGGGGGGAGGDGADGIGAPNAPSAGGAGGAGISSSLTGSPVTYGAGGAGARGNTLVTGTTGATNTGNGGGAGSAGSGAAGAGGNGGSGIVVLQYYA